MFLSSHSFRSRYGARQAWSEDKRSKMLETLCDQILRFAAGAPTTNTEAAKAIEKPMAVWATGKSASRFG
jgi:dihydroneopterin aldolase